MFFLPAGIGMLNSVLSALILLSIILFGIIMTFAVSKILSSTILKGVPSSFILELPPYRVPNIGSVVVRSIFDRTLFVLGRAVAVAAPAGLIIWFMSNVYIGDLSIVMYLVNILEPLGKIMGLDGVILVAFILGFPANEIVVPIMMMVYMATGTMTEMEDLMQMKSILLDNGWTFITALNMMLFSLMHFPCSTSCLTIKKETGSWKWTGVSLIIPTACGIIICTVTATLARIFGII